MLHKEELSEVSAPLFPIFYIENLFRLLFGRSYPTGKNKESTNARQSGFDKCKQMYSEIVKKVMEPHLKAKFSSARFLIAPRSPQNAALVPPLI